MADHHEFRLTPTLDPINDQFASRLLAELKAAEREQERRHPVLIQYCNRMPVGLKRQLKRARKKHGLTETAIINTALKKILPSLLNPREMQEEEQRAMAHAEAS